MLSHKFLFLQNCYLAIIVLFTPAWFEIFFSFAKSKTIWSPFENIYQAFIKEKNKLAWSDRLRHFIDKWVPFIGWAISAGYCNYLLKWWNASHCNLWNFNWIKSSVPFFIITLLETLIQYTYRIKLKTKCNKSIHPGLFLHKIA